MTDPSPQNLLEAALEISESASAIPLRHFRSGLAVEDKPDESPVTVADRQTEEHITRAILERFPSHGIFGEEFGRKLSDGPYTWIVDPIDGTRSFISGSPLFGTLLGVVRDGRAEAGVIRMPALGEWFAGCRGGAATWNGETVRCRPSPPLADARVFINEAERIMRHDGDLLARLMAAGRFMRFANDCYAFGLLAAGQIDVVVDFDLKPYDYMPCVPVVEAAGGVITDWNGEPLGLDSDGAIVAAGSRRLHEAMLKVLR